MKLYTFSMLDLAVIQDGNRDIFGYYPEQINVFVRKNPFLFEGYSGVRKRIDLLERQVGADTTSKLPTREPQDTSRSVFTTLSTERYTNEKIATNANIKTK